MKRLCKFAIPLLILMLITGCWDQNIYEDIGIVLSLGLDKGVTGDGILVTAALPIVSETSSGSIGQNANSESKKVEVISAEANLLRETRELQRLTSAKKLESGKIQNVLFGSDLAKERNISEYLSLFERDTQSTVQASVIIVEGSANELLSKGAQFEGKPRISLYLNDLLERNYEQGYCPQTNIVRYDILNFKDGISPVVPLVRLEENDIKVMGGALIDRDKMTGQLNTDEMVCLFIAMGKPKLSEIVFALPEELHTQKKEGIVFTRSAHSKMRILFENGAPVVKFDIKLNATLDEYTWDHITDQSLEHKIEKRLTETLQERLNEVFKKLQEANCDALGIGDKIHAYHNAYWRAIGNLDGWKKEYPTIQARFNIKADMVRYGEIK